tara:strand:- start:276 stop:539 length:264 start_codon:yes stop_codon:yes gene_type:complete
MNSQIDNAIQVLTNKQTILSVMVSLYISLFGGMAAPPLPSQISNLFNNQYFSMGIIALIAYGANSDVNMSVIASVLFYNIINQLNLN